MTVWVNAPTAAKIAVAAILYVLCGSLGLLLAVPPGYATVIWPASGIAVGALLAYGQSLWPGIFIGSFALNAVIGSAYTAEAGWDVTKLAVAAAIATGSTVQALTARWLVTRSFGTPLNLRKIRDVLTFIALGAPLSCLIAATVGVASLYFAGALPLDKLTLNWLTWWCGDVFGIVVFLPLVLIAPGAKHKLTWRGAPLGRIPIAAILVLLLPLGLTFYAWKASSEYLYERGQAVFAATVAHGEQALFHRLDTYHQGLLGAAGFIQGSDQVTAAEWRTYIHAIEIGKNFPGVSGIGFIRRVEPADLSAFLAATRRERPNFAVHPEAPGRPNFIIEYLEPAGPNAAAIGLNIAFEEHRMQAALLARDSGQPAITNPIVLIQDHTKGSGFLMLQPLYRGGEPADTIESRRTALVGWVYAPVVVSNFLRGLSGDQGKEFSLRIYDGNQINAERLIFGNRTSDTNETRPAFTVRRHVDVMQRTWTLVWNSTPAFERNVRSGEPLLILTGGLIFTALFGALLFLFAHRADRIGIVVDEKTRELAEREAHYRLLAENTSDVIVWSDLDTTRRYVSPVARTVLGYEPEELVGTRPLDFVHPDDVEAYRRVLDNITSGRVEQVVTCQRYRRKDGIWVWLEVSFHLTKDAGTGCPNGYVASLRDVTLRKQAEQQIAHMALHDGLTGLPNRTLFHDRLQHEIARAERHGDSFAVLACDLDGFKAVNDARGHPAGDALLRALALRLIALVRDSDTVARLGGDEFAIILSGLDQPQAASASAQRIIEAVAGPFDLDGHSASVGVSVGIVFGPQDGGDADILYKNADIALYRAKAAGRNTYRFYEPGMDVAVTERHGLELDLREAVQRGGFALHYQPIVNVSTAKVTGFEALMRWQHPLRGPISPAEFIPIAEETGLIVALGRWALHVACREAASWPDDIQVAVNISMIQFVQPGLDQTVMMALSASGLPAHRLELEITESVLMEDAEGASACLHRLRALGVRISLDDFGTGYSSLSYLRRFPFDKIKIDRSFIRDIANPDTAAIVRAVVGIGERLGAEITAEGVETAEQLEQVRQQGCTQVQGYLFSRPLPAAEALGLACAHASRAA